MGNFHKDMLIVSSYPLSSIEAIPPILYHAMLLYYNRPSKVLKRQVLINLTLKIKY